MPARPGAQSGELQLAAGAEEGATSVLDRFDTQRELTGQLKKRRDREEELGGTTSLEHNLVRENEHARLGEKISVHMLRLDDGEDLAVDQIKHLFPHISRDFLEPKGAGLARQVGGRRAEPYF